MTELKPYEVKTIPQKVVPTDPYLFQGKGLIFLYDERPSHMDSHGTHRYILELHGPRADAGYASQ